MVKTINSSCAIEANTSTEQQVESVLDGKRIIAPPKEIIEVKNAYDAYLKIDEYKPYETQSFLKAHMTLMKHLLNDAGRYRNTDVGVFDDKNIIHIGARPQFISSLMEDLFSWARTSEMNPIIKACVLHYEIETIHPFSDGNGRIGRLWQSVILCRYSELFKLMPIETLVHANQQRYYDSIERSRKDNSSTPFIEFMMEMILMTINTFGNISHKAKAEYLINLNENEKKALDKIISNFTDGEITAGQLREIIGVSNSAVRNYLKKFTDENILTAYGNNKGRRYILNKNVLL